MYVVNFKEVVFPKEIEKDTKKNVDAQRLDLIRRGRNSEEAAALIPDEKWDPIAECQNSIEQALNIYLRIKYYNQEKQMLIAPMDVRRTVNAIRSKLSLGDDTVNLSDDQRTFLLEVLKSELPPADSYIIIYDYLEKLTATSETI